MDSLFRLNKIIENNLMYKHLDEKKLQELLLTAKEAYKTVTSISENSIQTQYISDRNYNKNNIILSNEAKILRCNIERLEQELLKYGIAQEKDKSK